jgi:hypothetical protein
MKTTGGAHAYLGRRVGRGASLVSKLGTTAVSRARLELLLIVKGDRATPALSSPSPDRGGGVRPEPPLGGLARLGCVMARGTM